MYAGSQARLLVKRSSLQTQQTTLAGYIGSAPYNALPAAQQAAIQAQNNRALGTIAKMTQRVQRKTGHS